MYVLTIALVVLVTAVALRPVAVIVALAQVALFALTVTAVGISYAVGLTPFLIGIAVIAGSLWLTIVITKPPLQRSLTSGRKTNVTHALRTARLQPLWGGDEEVGSRERHL